MMVPYLSSVLSDSILTEDSYTKLDVIDRCYDAINEGVLDNFVVDVAASNTYSMMMEVLDNVKETLLKLVQNVLTFLNNYILNSALLADKYRDLIIQRFKSMKEPFVFYTYEYPKLKSKDYPVLVKSSISLEDEIREMEDEIIRKNLSPDEAASKVDKMLRSFGHDVLDARIDVSDLKSSVKKIIRDKIQGRQIQRDLTKEDLNQFINEIKTYKSVKDEITRTKANILNDYKNLRKAYMDLMQRKEGESIGLPTVDLKKLSQPEVEAFKLNDYQRFANINLHMTRLFNGFITIYSTAFDTKLNIIQEKIEANRAVIVEMLIRTGVFTSVNTKTPSKSHKPYVFNPSLKT